MIDPARKPAAPLRDRYIEDGHVLRVSDWHPFDCGCPICEANDEPAPLGDAARAIGARMFAGIVTGIAIAQGIGWLTGQPGFLVLFGAQ